MFKKACGVLLVCSVFLNSVSFAGLDSKKSLYLGGTVNSIKEGAEGTCSAKDEKNFECDFGGQKLLIPYEKVEGLEYGQKAGRRVGATMALGITTLGIGALPVLFSKKRKHFLTISWKNEEDKQQAAVIEFGKDVIRTTLATLEARTGKKVEYQDEEAKKSGRGN